MSVCEGLKCFVEEILESLRDSPLQMGYAFICFILMVLDYGVGSIVGIGDILDIFNMLGAMVFQGEDGKIDLKNLVLTLEFIPVFDLLPIEAIIIFWTLWDDHKWLVIIMMVIGVIASAIMLYIFGGFLGRILGLW